MMILYLLITSDYPYESAHNVGIFATKDEAHAIGRSKTDLSWYSVTGFEIGIEDGKISHEFVNMETDDEPNSYE